MNDKNNGFPNKNGQNSDKDKRPRVTLELKATEIPDASAAARQALPPPSSDPSSAADNAAGADALKETKRARGGNGPVLLVTHLTAGLAGGLLALIAAFYGVEHFRDRMTSLSGTTAEEIRGELSAVEKKLAELEKTAGNKGSGDAATAAQFGALSNETKRLSASLAALDSRIAKIEKAPRGETVAGTNTLSEDSLKPFLKPLEEKVAALGAKLESVAEAQSNQKVSVAATALAVAFNNLRRAVFSGKPFKAELDAVTKLGGGPDIATLSAYQEIGIATTEALEKDFGPLARSALAAEYSKEDSSFIAKLWGEAHSIIRIRRTGMVEGNTPEAILARTETRLKAGDVAAAAKEAGELKGEAAVILRPWLDAAKAHADAEAALDRMEARLLVSLKNEGASQ